MNKLEAIQQIEQDFEEGNGPFDDVEFPESRLHREMREKLGDVEPLDLTKEERLQLVSLFATLDYNRNANQLVDNILELYERDSRIIFDPQGLTSHRYTQDDVEEIFRDIGFRYGGRDAKGWYQNCEILCEKYNGRWHELLLEVSCDAPDLVEQLDDDGFLYLKGSKIAPMYARIINDEVAPLDGLWELDIPADTHIIRLTEELTETEMTADDVRAWWGVIGEQAEVERHVVDGGMWFIGNKWDQWGEEYWNEVLHDV